MRQQQSSGSITKDARYHEPGRVFAFYPHLPHADAACSCKSPVHVQLEGQCARPSELAKQIEEQFYRFILGEVR